MTTAIDITDPKLAKAYAHPLRVHILGLLDGRIASPREIADELGTPLSNTSYHVRQLVTLGLVELVGRTARRGAIEHHYTAKIRPTITDAAWARLPEIVKRELLAGGLQQAVKHMADAAERSRGASTATTSTTAARPGSWTARHGQQCRASFARRSRESTGLWKKAQPERRKTQSRRPSSQR
jgi:DNA-binding transcriptional ArsR family regulator